MLRKLGLRNFVTKLYMCLPLRSLGCHESDQNYCKDEDCTPQVARAVRFDQLLCLLSFTVDRRVAFGNIRADVVD